MSLCGPRFVIYNIDWDEFKNTKEWRYNRSFKRYIKDLHTGEKIFPPGYDPIGSLEEWNWLRDRAYELNEKWNNVSSRHS
jgi:hypothetical protein